QVCQTVAPRVVEVPIESARQTLPELHLQTVVAVPASIVDEIQAAVTNTSDNERIQEEEVYRVWAGDVGKWLNTRAGTKRTADSSARVNLIRRQRVSQSTGLAILQIGDERGVGEA